MRRPVSALLSRYLLPLVLGTLVLGPARAQIVIGQTAGLSGPVAASVQETLSGARLYIDQVNSRGGLRGETIELVSLDDRFDVPTAAENARVLIEERNVAALFLTRGTPHTQAILPLLTKHDIALVAPSTGAMLLHQPVNRHVFNVRSSYQREAEKAVAHLRTLGMNRIAVVHVDDTFGRDALQGAMKGFEQPALQPSLIAKVDRDKPDHGRIVSELVAAQVQAVLWLASGTAVVNGIQALRAAGSAAQVVTLSNNASSGFVRQLGTSSRGVIVSQVFPSERSFTHAFVTEAAALARAATPPAEVSPAMLEGFAAAKVLVEALRRAGPRPTRARVLAALDGLRSFDLGGLVVGYGPDDHTGLDFVDLSIISGDGKFRR